MNNLIYQVWTGELTEECLVSSKLMKKYADQVGAEYLLDLNPNISNKLCDVPKYFDWLNPVLDKRFSKYDKILSIDLDIFPVEGLKDNIFLEPIKDVGVCVEEFQSIQRETITIAGINARTDYKWEAALRRKYNVTLPRDHRDRIKVYNAGVVLFSKSIWNTIEQWMPLQDYIDWMRDLNFPRFYSVDQNYFHAMICCTDTEFTELSTDWNSQIYYMRGPLAAQQKLHDSRKSTTKFVHLQMTGMRWTEDMIYQAVNLPQERWEFEY